jgi:type VI secretion system FHA domain protein
MKLILQIIGAVPEDQAGTAEFGPEGGTLGRYSDNDWVLHNRYVSRHHGRILSDESGFYFKDLGSSDGSFVNERHGTKLEPHAPYALRDGDILYLGDFEILVTIIDQEPSVSEDWARVDEAEAQVADISVGPIEGEPAEPEYTQSSKEPCSGEETLEPKPGSDYIPDDWYEETIPAQEELEAFVPDTREAPPLSEEPLPPQIAPSLPPQASPALEAFLRGAKMDSTALDHVDEIAAYQALGVLVRETIEGLSRLMELRIQFKEQFLRLDRTRIAPTENNPLKVDLTVDQILQLLLTGAGPKYQPLPEAVAEAMLDTQTHFIAMARGMQAAFDALVSHLDPDRIQAQVDASAAPGFLGAKRKVWDVYRELYERIADADFYDTFGKEFARVYEEVENVRYEERSHKGGDEGQN